MESPDPIIGRFFSLASRRIQQRVKQLRALLDEGKELSDSRRACLLTAIDELVRIQEKFADTAIPNAEGDNLERHPPITQLR